MPDRDTNRALPAGIRLLPSGRYGWRVQANHRRLTGSADSLLEAVRDHAQAKLEAGLAAPSEVSVRELLAVWLADVDHAESTADRRDQALELVPAAFLDRPARSVTPVIVRALWRQMAADGVGQQTIVKASHALSRAYRHGLVLEMVDANPIAVVRPPRSKPARVHSPPPEDVRRLLEHVRRRPDLFAWVRFMAVVGARPGEICGLQWNDLDAGRRSVRVSRSINRRRNETPGKNGLGGHRDVPVDEVTFAALRGVPRIVGCPWVFTHDGRRPWRPQGATLEVTRALDRLDIEMRPYDLRHFAATQALAAGRPIEEVAGMLGDNPATVYRVYAHAVPSQSRSAAAVAAVLDGG